MASPAPAYRNSATPTTGKSARSSSVLKAEDVVQLISYLPIKRGPRNSLLGWYVAAKRPTGLTIQLFCASEGMETEARIKPRTAKYHRRYLESIGYCFACNEAVELFYNPWKDSSKPPKCMRCQQERCSPIIRLIYKNMQRIRPGYFRHTATWELSIPALRAMKPLQSYEERKTSRPIAMPIAPKSETSVEATDASATVAPVEPITPKKNGARKSHSLSSRERENIRKRIVPLVASLMKKHEESVGEPVTKSAELKMPRPNSPANLFAVPHPWTKVLELLAKHVDRHSFETWLKPSSLLDASNGVMTVRIPSEDFKHVFTVKYAEAIRDAIAKLKLGYERIVFEWPEYQKRKVEALTREEAVVEATLQAGVPLEDVLDATGFKIEPKGSA